MRQAIVKKKSNSTSVAKYLKWNDRERQIIDRSIEYFSLYGFDVGIRDIAAYIGVTQSLLYRYFSSKQVLIERIYKEMFDLSWKPEWETMLRDRSRPFSLRLVDYITGYCNSILNKEFVRLFLFGALAGTSFNKQILYRLHEAAFKAILDELYHDNRVLLPRSALDTQLDLEVVWGFHASFFYVGVRRWVYHLPVPGELRPVIRARVSAFLDGVGSEFSNRRLRNSGLMDNGLTRSGVEA